MRKLAKFAISLAVLWSLYWAAGAFATGQGLHMADEQNVPGWQINLANTSTSGFPIRFATEVAQIDIRHDSSGWGLVAEGLTLDHPSYQPQRLTAVFPPLFTVTTPYDRLQITSSQFEVAGQIRPLSNIELGLVRLNARELTVQSLYGTTIGAENLEATITNSDADARYQSNIMFEALGLPDHILNIADPERTLPTTLNELSSAAVLQIDRPLDRDVADGASARVTEIEIVDARLVWGDLYLTASGTLSIGADGLPTGNLDVYAENWREMVEIGVNIGLIPANMRGTWLTGLTVLSAMSGETTDITSVLSYANGQAFLGPIPIGPAPHLAPPQRQ